MPLEFQKCKQVRRLFVDAIGPKHAKVLPGGLARYSLPQNGKILFTKAAMNITEVRQTS
jgi:hypothetical protein